MPAILLAVTGADPQPWAEALRALAPAREIRLWPDGVGEGADIAYACAWYAPRGLYARLHRLQAIFSLGAGVEHILADPDLPDVPVVRNVEPDLTVRMTEYVVLHVLLHHVNCLEGVSRDHPGLGCRKPLPALTFWPSRITSMSALTTCRHPDLFTPR